MTVGGGGWQYCATHTYLGAHDFGGVLLGELGLGLGRDLVDDRLEVVLLVVNALSHGWILIVCVSVGARRQARSSGVCWARNLPATPPAGGKPPCDASVLVSSLTRSSVICSPATALACSSFLVGRVMVMGCCCVRRVLNGLSDSWESLERSESDGEIWNS